MTHIYLFLTKDFDFLGLIILDLVKTNSPNLNPIFSRVIKSFLNSFPLWTNTVLPIKLDGIEDLRDHTFKFVLAFLKKQFFGDKQMSLDDATSGVGVSQSGKSGGDAAGYAGAGAGAMGGGAGGYGVGQNDGAGAGLGVGGDAGASAGATGAGAGDATDNTSIGSINVNA
mgnify:CR=1 FL=1